MDFWLEAVIPPQALVTPGGCLAVLTHGEQQLSSGCGCSERGPVLRWLQRLSWSRAVLCGFSARGATGGHWPLMAITPQSSTMLSAGTACPATAASRGAGRGCSCRNLGLGPGCLKPVDALTRRCLRQKLMERGGIPRSLALLSQASNSVPPFLSC